MADTERRGLTAEQKRRLRTAIQVIVLPWLAERIHAWTGVDIIDSLADAFAVSELQVGVILAGAVAWAIFYATTKSDELDELVHAGLSMTADAERKEGHREMVQLLEGEAAATRDGWSAAIAEAEGHD